MLIALNYYDLNIRLISAAAVAAGVADAAGRCVVAAAL